MWKQKGVQLNWSDWIQFCLVIHQTIVLVHRKRTMLTCKRHCKHPPNFPRLHPKNRSNRTTRHPRNASQNKQYTEDPEPAPLAKNQTGYVKNIKPSASGPSDEHVKAQSKPSEQPFPVCLDYQCLKRALMMEKLKQNPMYWWKHLAKLLTTQAHHLQRRELSVL